MKKAPVKKLPLIRVAIIGCGAMAKNHAKAFNQNPDCCLVAAVDVDLIKAEKFCEDHLIPVAFASAKKMLAEVACDAVAIVAPDPQHAPLSIQCLKAGKHVLCEKPLALDYPEAKKMAAAARRSRRVAMVNFSYRNWPAIHAVAAVVRSGQIGKIRHVEASYLQSWLSSRVWGDWRRSEQWLWRLSSRHGSRGVLGDVGVHIFDFVTYPVGPIDRVFCHLRTFPKATGDRIGDYVLDANDSAVMTVEFDNGALGIIHTTRWSGGHANRLHLKISGTRGAVEIDSERSTSRYRICQGANLHRARWHEVSAPPVPTNHEAFVAAIRSRRHPQPDFARGAAVQKMLDACFKSDDLDRPVRI